MIQIDKTEVFGWESAVRGMRNPLNSWDKSDTKICPGSCDFCDFWSLDRSKCNCNHIKGEIVIGPNDLKLMKSLSKAGADHGKFLRMINVMCDINAPLYWWKEFDTYKVGTVANSCSTMHKIHAKEFEMSDFSTDKLHKRSIRYFEDAIEVLNIWRNIYMNGGMMDNYDGTARMYEPKDKDAWWQMIQLLPSSYNQKRTVQLNYQVLKNMYNARKSHKLDEWKALCRWCETLPYFKEICLGGDEDGK